MWDGILCWIWVRLENQTVVESMVLHTPSFPTPVQNMQSTVSLSAVTVITMLCIVVQVLKKES